MAASRWQRNKDIAHTLLGSRYLRRKILLYLCVVVVTMTAVGAWPLSDTLMTNPWVFVLYWLFCGGITIFMTLLAIYDLLAVVKEEKDKM